MYRVLIVDDEEIIVDGLYELFTDVRHVELEVHRAYSSQEALGKLNRLKMDIVFSDIRMPGLNGLQLQQIINDKWPFCKVVFVSGFTDFDYVQTALRNGGSDFILKTEGDEKVLEAMDKAIAGIQSRMETDRFMENAKRQWRTSLPLLRKDFLLGLVNGERKAEPSALRRRFEELEVSFNPDAPLFLLAGRIDEWPQDVEKADRMLFIYAMENLMAEYFERYITYYLDCGHNRFCLLLQEPSGTQTIEITDESTLAAFVQGSLDSIQTTFRELLKLPVSMIFSPKPIGWAGVRDKYRDLIGSLYRRLGWGREKLLTDDSPAREDENSLPRMRQRDEWLNAAKRIGLFLESGQKDECIRACADLMQADGCPQEWLIEIYYAAAMQIVRQMNDREQPPGGRFSIDRLIRLQDHDSWQEAMRYLCDTAEWLLEHASRSQAERPNELINRLHRFIDGNLGEDLSLTRLGETVYLNPAYLSRLYKQTTGIGLSEYVTQARLNRAKELLKKTKMKIQDIAGAVGFESAAYFSRFFKKETNVSPNEYRESVHSVRAPQ
ncbi:helix-turn-helix domain-containing protein [Paenibacillus sp. sptzw28]|uniref:helix-turn-helix domain-containing protein n=1 Tax=Paenibacillus sp. sptzw28 TaxID=715179 RepID=UPI001C6F2926|nr:helix-turn-helix domain-containing protein [Paenibacillus sp. sptzw28]QYR21029.1 helix-turn-helix domain-containing protein [Paenibacillus sp. sptzw28]